MMAYDLNKILAEYGDDDFGFSAVSEEEYNKVISDTTNTTEEYKARLNEVEKLVLPFFTKLLKTSDKEYIYWPNRKKLVEDQIQKLKGQLEGDDEEQPQQEAKLAGRPKEYSTRGKDKSPFGRDVTGSKDLKNQYKNESFIDMLKKNITKGGKTVISEGKSMLDEQNIIEN
jgi:hypothetical protein